MPSGLQGTIIKAFRLSSKQYNLFFSAYTWSDVVMSVAGSILIDKVVGLRVGYLTVTVIALLGQGVLTAGVFMGSFPVLVAGRCLFGCGMGTLKSIGNVVLASWFKDKEVTFAMSFTFCSCRFAASLGLVIPQMIYENSRNFLAKLGLHDKFSQIGFPFFIGFLLLLSSLFVCIVTVLLDIYGTNRSGREPPPKKRNFNIRDLKDFSSQFWLTLFSLGIFYSVLYTFVANGQLFFVSKFDLTTKQANIADFLVFCAPIIITPIIGYIIQIVGYNSYWGVFGALLGVSTHLLFCVSEHQLVLPFLLSSLFSLAYSFFGTSVYVIPSFIVQHHQLTTAYGLYNVVYSVLFTSSSIIAGFIIDFSGYLWIEIYFSFLLFICAASLALVSFMDKFTKDRTKKINKPGSLTAGMLDRWNSNNKPVRKRNDYYSNGFILVYHYEEDKEYD